jgi:GTP-binding protein
MPATHFRYKYTSDHVKYLSIIFITGGEVERIMNMVDGVLLVVDSVDGPKPQTKFVLKKALEKGIKAIVVVNKIDRPQARPTYVIDKVFDLFVELGATDQQMDFQIVYASGIQGIAGQEPDKLESNLQPLFKEIIKLPKVKCDVEKPLQILIANVDYDEFKGKMGIGRIVNGALSSNEDILYGKPNEEYKKCRIAGNNENRYFFFIYLINTLYNVII